jgi:membrane-bound lytic murein transglycosylase D
MRFRLPFAAMMLSAAGCAARVPAPAPTPEPPVLAPVAMAPDTGTRDTVVVPVVTDSEVVRRAAAIFDGVPAAAPASGPAVAETRPTWDIDVRSYETHQQVTQWVGIFTGRARTYMERSVSRGTRFDAMLRRKFRESGLPEDMTYLALIESSYSPHAYSRAAAVGMWQFMAPTARGMGMRVDWWVDERRDPMRSTDGAIDFLTDLHDAYGSWYLAAAAYNGGPGRVSRGLKRFSDEMEGAEGEDRFFALAEQKYLPRETKAYVPQLIAAAIVAKEPSRYGLRVDTLAAYAYDSVNVAGGSSFAAIAKAAGITLDAIRDLNPHFLRGATPPNEVSEVRVPVGAGAGFNAAFNALPAAEREAWREERMSSARSAQDIADEAGIPVKALRWVNPRLSYDRRGRVAAGTLLRIPTPGTVSGARDVPDPSLARTSSGGTFGGAPAGKLVSQRVRVRSGESLASVARRSGVTVKQLRAMNRINGSRVRSGQVLVVRRPTKKAIEAARRSAARSRAGRSAAARDAGEERCSSRVVRVRGKRRTVTTCAPARPSATATRRARASSRPAAASARRGSARTASARKKPAPASRVSARGRAAKKAAPRSARRSAAPKKKAPTRRR